MPGRLIMDQQGATGSQDLKKDRSHAQEANLPPKPAFVQNQALAPQINGPTGHAANGSLPNGVPAQNGPPPTTNGASTASHPAPAGLPTPPQLDQSWRETSGNKSMGTLISRLSQQCYVDLNDTLTAMSEIPVSPAGSQPNGIMPNTVDSSEGSLSKKRTFMEFAKGQRDRFIKTLVLSDWARSGEDMATLIDIKVYLETQARAQRSGIDFIAITKNDIQTAKMPNPNIEGALGLLATGTAARIPDLGYLPPKRLTAKQLLRTLQDMNVTLASRLDLHEELPAHFSDFSIANGRATFKVPGEFEVDLSVADEEDTSPFYFIDIRFLFTPTPSLSNEGLRAALEVRANGQLATKGLEGCYDFLHNFVLTHKINVLRDQANKLLREKWFDCLRIDLVRRVLTLQYWTGVRGPKSWIEVGVSTGKQKGKKSRKPPNPRLSVRWFRRGALVEEPLEIDWQNLDIEKILTLVIAKHASWALNSSSSQLQAQAGADSKLDIELKTSDSTPEDCSLTLSIPGLRTSLTLRHEPVTGQICISPPTKRSAGMENALNNDANLQPARLLEMLLCKSLQDRVDQAVILAGWETVKDVPLPQNNNMLFGSQFPAVKMYRCSTGWGRDWAVVITYGLAGEKWWIARFEDRPTPNGGSVHRIVANTRQLPVKDVLTARATVSRASLLQIEKLAAAEVSMAVLSYQLTSMEIKYRTEKTVPLTLENDRSALDLVAAPTMFFRSAQLLKDNSGKDSAIDSVRLTHRGLLQEATDAEKPAEMRQEIRLNVESGKLKHLQDHLTTKSRDSDIAMNESGALALKLRTPFGLPYIQQVCSRLKACERLNRDLQVMKMSNYENFTVTGLSQISFTYNEAPELSAALTYAGRDGDLPARLKLEPMGSNPHQRIRVMLENEFNGNSSAPKSNPVLVLSLLLSATLPLLRALEKLEVSHSSSARAFAVHIRNPTRYWLVYKAPFPEIALQIGLQYRIENGMNVGYWKITSTKTRQDLPNSNLGKAILALAHAQQKSKDWQGFEDGTFITLSHAVEEALEKLDELVRKHAGADGADSKQESALKTDARSQTQQSQQKQQQPQQKPAPKSSGPGSANAAAAARDPAKVKKEVIELD